MNEAIVQKMRSSVLTEEKTLLIYSFMLETLFYNRI